MYRATLRWFSSVPARLKPHDSRIRGASWIARALLVYFSTVCDRQLRLNQRCNPSEPTWKSMIRELL